jgi:alkylation response protein AidB-like acyl-CoA dehydrogenase
MDVATTHDIDFIARARALAPEIVAAAAEIEERRELPPALVQRLIESGFFRMLQPQVAGWR